MFLLISKDFYERNDVLLVLTKILLFLWLKMAKIQKSYSLILSIFGVVNREMSVNSD